MVDRGLTLAVLPPSPRQGTAITYATRSTVPTTPTRTTTDSPGEVERDARNAYVVYFEARAIRAGVIFSSAMHGRRYSRREQSASRLAPEERASRGKKDLAHGSAAIFNARSPRPPSRARKVPETRSMNMLRWTKMSTTLQDCMLSIDHNR